MQRFQLAVWPDDPREWVNVDRIPDHEAEAIAFEIFKYLNTLTAQNAGAIVEEHGQIDVPFLHFTDEAQDRFDQWMYNRENRLRQGQEDGAMESHLTKYRSLIPSLALLIHLAELRTGPVGRDVLKRAIRWEDYLSSHARRIYASSRTAANQPDHLLAAKIQQGHLQDGFTLRDVYGHHWSGLNNKEQLKTTLLQLTDYGWLKSEKRATGGRPTTIYRINPKLFK
jgi:putative DNA primase/helicase